MHTEKVGQSINFHLKNISFLRFSSDSRYDNIISPFTRLYLITEGHGHLALENEKLELISMIKSIQKMTISRVYYNL